MTLKELMRLPSSKNLIENTPGVSNDRQIKYVRFVSRVTDIIKIKTKELVVLNDGVKSEELIRQIPSLIAKEAVLLMDLTDEHMYLEFFEQAKRYGLPVLQPNGDVSLHDLIQELNMEEYRETSINYTNKFLNQYNVNEIGGISNLVKALERTIKMPIFVFDGNRDLLVCGREQAGSQASTYQQFEDNYGKYNLLKYSLGYCGDLYVACKTERMPLVCETAVLNSLLALAIGISNCQNVYEENRNKFICGILNRKINESEINENRLNEFKLDIEAEYFCIAIDLKNKASTSPNSENGYVDNNKRISKLLSTEIKKCLKKDTIIVVEDKTLIVLYPTETKEGVSKNAANYIVKDILECSSKFFTNYIATLGVSSSCSPIMKVNIPFIEAMQALKLGNKIFGSGSITHYDDLSMYRILLEMDDISRINKSMAFIKKIEEYDQNNNTELMNTLEVYYGSNFSLKETAYKLFLHYNSISYRLKKISELTNVDITTSDGMFTLIVGMKLKKLL